MKPTLFFDHNLMHRPGRSGTSMVLLKFESISTLFPSTFLDFDFFTSGLLYFLTYKHCKDQSFALHGYLELIKSCWITNLQIFFDNNFVYITYNYIHVSKEVLACFPKIEILWKIMYVITERLLLSRALKYGFFYRIY